LRIFSSLPIFAKSARATASDASVHATSACISTHAKENNYIQTKHGKLTQRISKSFERRSADFRAPPVVPPLDQLFPLLLCMCLSRTKVFESQNRYCILISLHEGKNEDPKSMLRFFFCVFANSSRTPKTPGETSKKMGSTRWRDDFFCCFSGCSRKVANNQPATSILGDSNMRAQKYREVGGRGPVLENSGGADPIVHAHWDKGAAAEGLSQLRSALSPAAAARPKPSNRGTPPKVPNP